ncbi:TIGR02677 family protein [Tomitella biformata]|uniref:TIGR02677 family protein n=1 Tax=Tomitella biformata TaxID=630403 RepID=UPI0004B96676|nr:TIGR02677 family protein [Tomitella biformata]
MQDSSDPLPDATALPDAAPRPFAHLQAQNAATYRQIMGAFVQAKRRFTVHLRPEDVREAIFESSGLAPEPTTVNDALVALEGWGNLRSDPDTSRVTTVEDFRRARYLYQLSPHGEAAEEALDTYDGALGRRGALQSVALIDIAEQLRILLELARAADPDPAKAYPALVVLAQRFQDLAANAQAFMGALARTIDLQDGAADAFVAYKDRLIEYLQRFIKDLLGTGGEIARLIEDLEAVGVGRLLEIAAARESQDVAPDPAHPTPTAADAAAELLHSHLLWQDRWQGIRAWFVGTPHQSSQAAQLRAQARAAVPRLLQVVAALNERRSGRSDRAADFRTLALWFAQATDDASMHRLWRGAFGLSPSRHLTIDMETLDARDEDPVDAGMSWASAPPLLISPRLRRTGSYERRGKPNRVQDRTSERRYLAERATREAAEVAAARARLATDGPIRLSDIGRLDPPEFRLFLGLLGDALASKAAGATRVETSTSDGSMAISLAELPAGDSGRAHIETPHGVFSGPDHLVQITDLASVSERTA